MMNVKRTGPGRYSFREGQLRGEVMWSAEEQWVVRLDGRDYATADTVEEALQWVRTNLTNIEAPRVMVKDGRSFFGSYTHRRLNYRGGAPCVRWGGVWMYLMRRVDHGPVMYWMAE